MVDVPLARRFVEVTRRIEALPRRRYAIVMAIGWFVVWVVAQAAVGRALHLAALSGVAVALFFGVLQYYLWDYR